MKTIFFVSPLERAVLVWTIGPHGELLDEEGEETSWTLREDGVVSIFEGSHAERGDRDELHRLDELTDRGELITPSRARAEERLAELKLERRGFEILQANSLDAASVAKQRKRLLEVNGLDDASVEARRNELLGAHGFE